MKIFDYNIHLIKDVDIEKDLSLKEMKHIFKKNLKLYKENFTNGNFMLFNSELPDSDIGEFKSMVVDSFKKSTITLLYDYKKKRSLKKLKKAGVDFIKFHSYVQEIEEEDFKKIVKISKEAEELGIGIMVDTSYGTLGLYRYDNLRLAAEIANKVKKVPIVLLHSGGARCIDAMLIAMSEDNIYLETSFSLPFYIGTTVEQDLAFAYKKLAKKVIYGSDYPYVDFNESIEKHSHFLQQNKFSKSSRESIFHSTII